MAQLAKTDTIRDTSDNLAQDAARGVLQAMQKTAEAVTHWPAEGSAELGQALVDLLKEQNQHNLETLAVLTKAVDLGRIFEIQGEFLRGSLERVEQLTQAYFEVTQRVITAPADTVKERSRKVA